MSAPIYLAVLRSNVEAVQLLVDAGVDINTPNKLGQTPLDLVNLHKDLKIKKLLEKALKKPENLK